MSHCQNCSGEKLMSVSGKCSDLSFASVEHLSLEHDGYVLSNLNFGGGDYIDFEFCLECGHMQGTWPLGDDEVKDSFNEKGH